ITLVIDDGTVTKVFYPVFPPAKSADVVVAWLQRPRYARTFLTTVKVKEARGTRLQSARTVVRTVCSPKLSKLSRRQS
ncbi:MAG: hypothetical protein WCD25_15955, partial [Pseudolabrys sp.]